MTEPYSRSLEREVKIMLTGEEFERILCAFEWEQTVEQVNHYYIDPQQKLSAEHINVRVREKNDTISLQVKSLVKNIDGGPSVHREIEKKIDSVPEHIDAETVKDMTGITTVGAFKVGELTTQRRICHRGEKSNIEICLDKSDYLGITDYELELEYTGDALSQVMEIVNDLSLSPQKQPEGKMSRFYKRYKQLH